jgi:hypothetical protein
LNNGPCDHAFERSATTPEIRRAEYAIGLLRFFAVIAVVTLLFIAVVAVPLRWLGGGEMASRVRRSRPYQLPPLEDAKRQVRRVVRARHLV